MKCRDCDACHMTSYTRWNPVKQCMHRVDVYECWGVREPFEIFDIDRECTEYIEKRDEKVDNEKNVCPCCGRKLEGEM